MKTVGAGGRGLVRGCIDASRGSRLPFLRLHGSAGGDDVLPGRGAAPAARDDVVHGQARVRLTAAVLARPGIAGEHRLAGDLPAVHVARDPDVADEPDHAGTRHLESLRAERSLAGLEHLRALLEDKHRGPPHRADVDGLVGGVEDEDTRARHCAAEL